MTRGLPACLESHSQNCRTAQCRSGVAQDGELEKRVKTQVEVPGDRWIKLMALCTSMIEYVRLPASGPHLVATPKRINWKRLGRAQDAPMPEEAEEVDELAEVEAPNAKAMLSCDPPGA